LELVMDDGPRRASLLAGGRDAVLADVTHHEPAAWRRLVVGQHFQPEPLICRSREPSGTGPARLAGPTGVGTSGELFDELDVPPGRGRQLRRVVVAVAGPVE